MNKIIEEMIRKYDSQTVGEKKNSVKEVIQEVALCGLSRAGFFKSAVFYGGTALRIFYGLDRFSEDLDFSLMKPNPNFDITQFFPILEAEVKSLGLNFEAHEKAKSAESNIKSAFIKGNTKEHLLMFYQSSDLTKAISSNELIKIKFEVDINPPKYASFERKYKLLPYPYEIGLYDLPSLFAGKIHAVICRGWKNRVKGRDLYDYIFYLSRRVPINIKHLQARFIQSEYINAGKNITIDDVKQTLNERFEEINYAQAKEDVEPFIKDTKSLDMWSKDFFTSISENLTAE